MDILRIKAFLSRNLLVLALFTFIVALIWFGGPAISINNHSYLKHDLARFITILIIALAWGTINFFRVHKITFHHIHHTAAPETVSAECQAIRESFSEAVEFLNRRLAKIQVREGTIYTLPWYLVIGTKGSGKSSLMAHSGIPFAEAQKFVNLAPPESLSTSLNWWFTHLAVLVDVPGLYIDQPENMNNTRLGWLELLHLLKTKRKLQPINGVIVTFKINELLNDNNEATDQIIKSLRERLQECMIHFGCSFPVYLVATHIDTIAGFNAYFDDLGATERTQAWGINFQKDASLKTTDTFNNEFDKLLKRLHDRVLWRIHQERNVSKRALIRDFPLQFSQLKEPLSRIIYELTNMPQQKDAIQYSGIYFTSATVNLQDQQVDPIFNSISRSFELVPLKYVPPHSRNIPAYFIKQLMQDFIFSEAKPTVAETKTISTDNWMQLTSYGFAFGLLILATTIWTIHFNDQYNKLSSTADAITQYKMLSSNYNTAVPSLTQLLPSLNALRIADSMTQQLPTDWLFQWNQGKQNKLNSLATHVYQAQLQSRFMPALQSLLVDQISNTANTNPNNLYAALKIYLMLSDPAHRDSTFIKNWLHDNWSALGISDNEVQNQLDDHLSAALNAKFPALAIDLSAVNIVRNTLNSLPSATLAYSILENHFPPIPIQPVQLSASSTSMTLPSEGISNLYTSTQFANIYQAINEAADTLIKGNWVLGEHGANNALMTNSQQLQQAIRTTYLNDYVNAWQTWLDNIKVNNFTDLSQASKALAELSGNDSPLFHVLTAVANNTSASGTQINQFSGTDASDIQNILINHFQNINGISLSVNDKSISLQQIAFTLKQLSQYMQNIAQANDSNAAAYSAAKSRMKGGNGDPISLLLLEANQAPEPLKTWLNTIAMNSWQLVLTDAHNYMNTQWQSEVMSVYNSQLNNRYPLFSNATDDVNLSDFANFFKPDGLVQTYFNDYLAPFVDTSGVQWKWRSRDGLSIDNSLTVLDQFERSNIIQKMFFDKYGILRVNFTLQMINLDPSVKSIDISINDQKSSSSNQSAALAYFSWPGTDDINNVTINLQNDEGQIYTVSEDGPWAWFKVLDKTNLQQDKDSQHFNLEIDMNNFTSKFSLIASSPINPFIPGIVNQYRAPDNI